MTDAPRSYYNHRKRWTEEHDRALLRYVASFGMASLEPEFLGRTPSACRTRHRRLRRALAESFPRPVQLNMPFLEAWEDAA